MRSALVFQKIFRHAREISALLHNAVGKRSEAEISRAGCNQCGIAQTADDRDRNQSMQHADETEPCTIVGDISANLIRNYSVPPV
jgi:hypothetical protein